MLLIRRTKTQRKPFDGSSSLLMTSSTTACQEICDLGQDQTMNTGSESIISGHEQITFFNVLLGVRLWSLRPCTSAVIRGHGVRGRGVCFVMVKRCGCPTTHARLRHRSRNIHGRLRIESTQILERTIHWSNRPEIFSSRSPAQGCAIAGWMGHRSPLCRLCTL